MQRITLTQYLVEQQHAGTVPGDLRFLLEVMAATAQGIAANANEATTDLGALRGEVEANLRKVESLLSDINRKWPFAKDSELKLP